MSSLQGKTALVTGGGRGIGRATALALAHAGCDVAVIARTRAQVEQVATDVQAVGQHGAAFACDMADGRMVSHTFADIRQALGPIDILINNASVVEPLGHTVRIDPEEWAHSLAINLTGAFRWIQLCLSSMLERRWGRIVSLSSGAATGTGMPQSNAYSVSKAGLEMLTVNLAAELTGSGVTVNAVRPGLVDTAMQAYIRQLPVEQVGHQLHEQFTGFYEQAKLQSPELPARLIVHLLMGESSGEIVNISDQRGQELLGDALK